MPDRRPLTVSFGEGRGEYKFTGDARHLDHPSGPIWIVDTMFSDALVEELASILVALPYRPDRFVTDETDDILLFKTELEPRVLASGLPIRASLEGRHREGLVPNELLSILTLAVESCARALNINPSASGRFRRIYVNAIPFGSHLAVHTDEDLLETTSVIYFANSAWQNDWHGELIMYDVSGESLYAIAPKPGRIVFFPGRIPHRVAAPSRTCFLNRLTVVFKYEWK